MQDGIPTSATDSHANQINIKEQRSPNECRIFTTTFRRVTIDVQPIIRKLLACSKVLFVTRESWPSYDRIQGRYPKPNDKIIFHEPTTKDS